MFCCVISIEVHQSCLSCMASLRIGNSYVLHGGMDSLVSETVLNQRQIYIAGNEMRGQRVLEDVRMTVRWWQARSGCACAEDTKELSSMEVSALLREEKEIRAICPTVAEPAAQCSDFVEQGLAFVSVQRLYRVQGAFQTSDG